IGCVVFAVLCLSFEHALDYTPRQHTAPKNTRVQRIFRRRHEQSRYVTGGEGAESGAGGRYDRSRHDLLDLLNRLTKERRPSMREKLIERARQSYSAIKTPLIDILYDGENPKILIQAILLVAALDMKEAASVLTIHVYGDKTKVAATAIRALDLMQPWSDSDIEGFLGDSRPLIVEAGLQVAATRDKRPMDLILILLSSPNDLIRTAAIRAIPKLESGEYLDTICNLTQATTGPEARTQALAMGMTGVPKPAEERLNRLLASKDWTVQRAALEALSRKKSRLENPRHVLGLLKSPETSKRLKAHGFVTLEKTKTVPVAEIRAMLPSLHPVPRLLALRCLLVAGDRTAIPALIDLLETPESETVNDEDAQYASLNAQAVLEEISGRSIPPDKRLWTAWYRDLGKAPLLSLKSKPEPTW
ncbi:MAG: HEAT repeat domain-containing protein, partial [Planctomycetota bacterium]